MEENEQKAERRGYAKGYTAGKARRVREISKEALYRRELSFWQRAFLAVLPAAFSAQGWARGEKPISSLDDRIRLAAEAADEAMKQAKKHIYQL